MKTIIISALLLFSAGAVTAGDSMYSANKLFFETTNGEKLQMEVYEEQENKEDVPEFLRALIYHEQINPEDHQAFQALVKSLQKPEKEDKLPFELN